MDKLAVLREAHRLGGPQRSRRMSDLAVFARKNECVVNASAGRGGTMQIRYGALNLPVLDMSAEGVVTVYVRPSTNPDHMEALTRSLTEAIRASAGLKVAVAAKRASAKSTEPLENIEQVVIEEFIVQAVGIIRENVYQA